MDRPVGSAPRHCRNPGDRGRPGTWPCAVLALAVLSLALSACGSSSPPNATGTTTSTGNTTRPDATGTGNGHSAPSSSAWAGAVSPPSASALENVAGPSATECIAVGTQPGTTVLHHRLMRLVVYRVDRRRWREFHLLLVTKGLRCSERQHLIY